MPLPGTNTASKIFGRFYNIEYSFDTHLELKSHNISVAQFVWHFVLNTVIAPVVRVLFKMSRRLCHKNQSYGLMTFHCECEPPHVLLTAVDRPLWAVQVPSLSLHTTNFACPGPKDPFRPRPPCWALPQMPSPCTFPGFRRIFWMTSLVRKSITKSLKINETWQKTRLTFFTVQTVLVLLIIHMCT